MLPKANIGISDSHTIFRNSLSELIMLKGEYRVILEASSADELFQQLSAQQADILITDIYFLEDDGLTIIEKLRKNYPQLKIIVLSLCFDPDIIGKAFSLGVYGYISKTANLAELWEALNQIHADRLYENKILKESLYYQASKRLAKDNSGDLIKNNPVYLKILELLWQEKNTREIARQLFMSVSSIEKIKQQLKEDTGARSTIGLIKYALQKKLILPTLHTDAV